MKNIFKKATVMALTLAVGMSLVAGCGSDKKDDKAAVYVSAAASQTLALDNAGSEDRQNDLLHSQTPVP